MAVIRCPHCNKPNPDFLDSCQYCDQPIKVEPLAADDAGTAPAAASQEPVRSLSEWDAFESARPAARPAAEGEALPGWLSALETDTPASPSAPTTGEAEALPDWLSAIDADTDTAAVSAPVADVQIPDWLAEEPVAPQPAPGVIDPPASAVTETPAQAALPDWLSSLQPVEAPELAAPPSRPDLPDWLREDTPLTPAPPAASSTTTTGDADWSGGAAPLPDWLSEADAPSLPGAAPGEAPSTIGRGWSADTRLESPVFAQPSEHPDWLADVTEPGPEGVTADEPQPAQTPDWLQALNDLGPERLDNQSVATSPDPLSVPGGHSADVGRPVGRDSDRPDESGLEPPELPAWLSAMRPVEVKAPASPTGDGDPYEEAVGVLAGMRGVLRAEPSVVLPGKNAAQAHALTMTDSQARAAQVLAAIARAETGAADPKAKRRFRWPMLRWAITLALLVGAVIPFIFPGLFMAPRSIARLTEAAVITVEALDATGPVLVAIDYEPGQAGELDPAASALLRHLMRQGLPVATVSTNPGGAGLAQRLLSDTASDFGLGEYTHFVNLGYIPGGPAGVLAFGIEPRSVFLADFSGSGAVWDSPAVQGIRRLNDFAAVIVISGSPETARAWIEQTQQLLDASKPFVIATSASADPLLRPYTASVGGPVDGYIAGLAGVAQYEAKAGLAGVGQTRFAQIGALLWVAAAAIVIANALSVLRHVRVKRQ